MSEPFSEEGAPSNQIDETEIEKIVMSASSTWNEIFYPADGWARWFRDELGQLWVRFYANLKATPVNEGDLVQCHCWPASRVIEVIYKPKTKQEADEEDE